MVRAPSQCAQMWTQKAPVVRSKACGRGVPLPETVAACACQISTGESRSNNATQNTVKQPFPAERIGALASTCAVDREEGCSGVVGMAGSLHTGYLEMCCSRTFSAVLAHRQTWCLQM